MAAKKPAKGGIARAPARKVEVPLPPVKRARPVPLTAKKHRPWWAAAALLAALLGAVYLGFQDRYGLFDVDEAIFTQATREMRATHVWSMPSYNGEPRYQKPPLIYWLQAASMEVLGDGSLWAARLPSAVSALLAVALLGVGLLAFTGSPVWALVSAAALGLNLSFVVVGRAATADGALNLLMLALVMWTLRQIYGLPYRGSWLLGGALVALGLLAKGPVAGVPAALVLLPLLALRHDRVALFLRLEPLKVLTVALVGLAPWVWLLAHDGRLAFFTQFFLVENLQRFGGGFKNTQSHNPFYYLFVIMFGFMPWVFFLPRAVWQAAKGFAERVRAPLLADALPALCLVWAAGIVLLFSFSGTKLAHYIVPAYPALAILVGWLFAQKLPGGRKRPVMVPGLDVWAGLQIALVGVVFMLLPSMLEQLRGDTLHGALGWAQDIFGFEWPPRNVLTHAVLAQAVPIGVWPIVGGMAMILGVGNGYWLAARRERFGLPLMAGGMAAFLLCAVMGVVPVVWAYTQGGLASLAEDIAQLPEDVPLIHLGLHKPSVLYLSQRPFIKLEQPLQLAGQVRPYGKAAVLVEQADVPGIQREMGDLAILTTQRCAGGYCIVLVDRAGK